MLQKLQRPTTREDLAGVLTQRWKTPSRLYSVWHRERNQLSKDRALARVTQSEGCTARWDPHGSPSPGPWVHVHLFLKSKQLARSSNAHVHYSWALPSLGHPPHWNIWPAWEGGLCYWHIPRLCCCGCCYVCECVRERHGTLVCAEPDLASSCVAVYVHMYVHLAFFICVSMCCMTICVCAPYSFLRVCVGVAHGAICSSGFFDQTLI